MGNLRGIVAVLSSLAVILFLVGCGFEPLAPKSTAIQNLKEDLQQVDVLQNGSLVTRISGTQLSFGNSPEESVENFLANYEGIFGVALEKLSEASSEDWDILSEPLIYEKSTGRFKFTLIKIVQKQKGIPVFRSDIRFLVLNIDDHPLIMAVPNLTKLNGVVTRNDSIPLHTDAAYKITALGQGRFDLIKNATALSSTKLTTFSEPKPILWTGTGQEPVQPTHAFRFTGNNFADPKALKPVQWRFFANMDTGSILHKEELILFTNLNDQLGEDGILPPFAYHCSAELYEHTYKTEATIIGESSIFVDHYDKKSNTNKNDKHATSQRPILFVYNEQKHHAHKDSSPTEVEQKQGVCGMMLPSPIWNILEELRATEPSNHLRIFADLTFGWMRLRSMATIDSQTMMDFLLLDDDDGILTNGTPHMKEICKGFGISPPVCLQQKWPTLPKEIATTEINSLSLPVECTTSTHCANQSFCDGLEMCSDYRCHPGTPIDCNDDLDCTDDICNEDLETCDHFPDNSACDDGSFCNGYEICDAQTGCQPGSSPCSGTSCDDRNNKCGCLSDTDCDDGAYCNGVEKCKQGSCIDGTPIACNDALGCTFDSCNEETDSCEFLPDNSLCDDGDDCTQDTCNPANGCENTKTENCRSCIQETSTIVTHVTAGRAYRTASNDCSACWYACNFPTECAVEVTTYFVRGSDENLGTNSDVEVTLYSEDAGTLWSTHQCSTPCTSDEQCRDELYCNGEEACVKGICQKGSPIRCNDKISCTKDTCNEDTDSCEHLPDDFACDDGHTCTEDSCIADVGCKNQQIPDCELCISFNTPISEHISSGRMHVQKEQDCTDCWHNCSFPIGCAKQVSLYYAVGSNERIEIDKEHSIKLYSEDNGKEWSTSECALMNCSDDEWCDDLQHCNGKERCINGYCQSGVPVDCDDGVSCTIDSCDEATDICQHQPNDAICDDKLFCNGKEICNLQKGCEMGEPPCPQQDCDEENKRCGKAKFKTQ